MSLCVCVSVCAHFLIGRAPRAPVPSAGSQVGQAGRLSKPPQTAPCTSTPRPCAPPSTVPPHLCLCVVGV